MLGHLQAIAARIETPKRRVFLIDVPENESPAFPYCIVWASAGNVDALTLDGGQTYLREQVGVTSVGLTPEAALIVANKTRALLMNWKPIVDGWHSHELRLLDSRPVQADRDVTLPNSNRHPYFAVDMYTLHADQAQRSGSSSSS